MIQKVKDDQWKDETGNMVPIKYVSSANRLREHHAGVLLKEAKLCSTRLADFKQQMQLLCSEVLVKTMEELKSNSDGKGNFTWFNFDRSIKIEVSISDRIDFDDLTITACKEKLDEFLNDSLDSKQEFVKQLVTDAFSTSRGKLDSKKVMSLLKYRSKINDEHFQEALNLLESSIRRPDSKTYFRIWERDEEGKYFLIDLNFSSL